MLTREKDPTLDVTTAITLLFTGATVGALLALLFAPGAGAETRERIGDWIQNQGERGREVASRLREKIPGRIPEPAMGEHRNRV